MFDDPNVVSSAGLVPALQLAEAAGLHDLLEEHLSVGSPHPVAKATSVVGGMLAGADSIDDMDLLRHGGMPKVFSGLRAPSTLGTYLRTFTHGHVQQLDAVSSRLLARLAARVPGLLAGAEAEDGIGFIDVDDTIREVHGYAKQAAGYGYTKVRGLNIQLAAVSTHYGYAFVGAAIRAKAWYSVTTRANPPVNRAIASIPEEAWRPIKYPNAIWEEAEPGLGHWVSDAEVAEVQFSAFTSRRKHEHVQCRLVVRRVKRLQPLAGDGTQQGELMATYRHHAFITNSTLGLVEADQRHRDHAIVEQVIAELKDGPLAHLPSGKYTANAAWLAHAVIGFNIARALDAATPGHHRWATLRTRIINVPARIASTGRRLVLHLPRDWPWADTWQRLHQIATGPPAAVIT